jgi:hypothetical protein
MMKHRTFPVVQEVINAKIQNTRENIPKHAKSKSLNGLAMGFVTRGDITTRVNASTTAVIAAQTLVFQAGTVHATFSNVSKDVLRSSYSILGK